ncbi:hypothetical protein D3C87_1200390 [compost metagenome]
MLELEARGLDVLTGRARSNAERAVAISHGTKAHAVEVGATAQEVELGADTARVGRVQADSDTLVDCLQANQRVDGAARLLNRAEQADVAGSQRQDLAAQPLGEVERGALAVAGPEALLAGLLAGNTVLGHGLLERVELGHRRARGLDQTLLGVSQGPRRDTGTLQSLARVPGCDDLSVQRFGSGPCAYLRVC